jgi:Cytochrome P460
MAQGRGLNGSGRRMLSMWARAAALVILALIGQASAQSPPVVAYPRDYKTSLVKYGVVDRSDGMSRDLYASRAAIEALKRDPRLREFPVGALFALDVYSARVVGRDPKTRTPRFEVTPQGHLVRSKDERTLHLMQKIQPGFGSQNWAFGGFDPVTSEPLKLDLPGDCQLCHQAALVSDMAFSLNLLKRFAASGTVQYSFCPHPGRQACPFQ